MYSLDNALSYLARGKTLVTLERFFDARAVDFAPSCDAATAAVTVAGSSTKFPCEAIGICPSLDEDGEEIECHYQVGKGCQPSNMCTVTRMLPVPACDLKPGYKQWKKQKAHMLKNVGALAEAVQKLPKCGEEGASELFCVNEPTGFSLLCEYVGYIFVFVFGTFNSVRAIETKGGDDDRQWLTFWIIYFIFTIVERLSSVLLSQIPVYYELKLCVIVWLFPPFYGARWLYVVVHQAFNTVRKNKTVRFILRLVIRAAFTRMDDDELSAWLGEERLSSAVAFGKDVHDQHAVKTAYKSVTSKAVEKMKSGQLEELLKKSKLCGRALDKRPGAGRMYSRAAGRGKITMPDEAELAAWTPAQMEAAAKVDLGDIDMGDTARLQAHRNYPVYQRLNALLHVGIEMVHQDVISQAKQLMEQELHALVSVPTPPQHAELEARLEEALASNQTWQLYTSLQREWREREVRFLELYLKRATNLPRMDINLLGSCCDPMVKVHLRNEYPLAPKRLAKLSKDTRFSDIAPLKSYKFYPHSSSVKWKQQNPEWNEILELALTSGEVDGEGEWQNLAAPFHTVVLELFDADFPSFLGNKDRLKGTENLEIAVGLHALMDGRQHDYVFEWEYEDDDRKQQTASLTFTLRYCS